MRSCFISLFLICTVRVWIYIGIEVCSDNVIRAPLKETVDTSQKVTFLEEEPHHEPEEEPQKRGRVETCLPNSAEKGGSLR